MAKPSGFSSGFGPGFGVGRYRYVLTPWVWDTANASLPHWRLPSSAVGGVDLRPLPAQAIAGGAPQGFAFAASMQPVAGTEIAVALHMAEENATSAMQDAWQSAMGYRPQGAKLVDILWDQLTTGSDPSGENGPKPLMPGVDLQLNLFVPGHSLVKQERFRFGVHPHTNRVRDLLRRDFEAQWEATNGHDHCRRCLDFTCEKYRVKDWREFVPTRLHAHVPGRLPHATTITDNFTRANGDTIGNLLTWTEVLNDWDTVSNAVNLTTTDSESTARAESDVSSADHYGQASIAVPAVGTLQGGVCARFASAADTAYHTMAYRSAVAMYLRKRVAGTNTTIAGPTGITLGTGAIVYKCEASGSTITDYQSGVQINSTTDTAISGGTRGGFFGFHGSDGSSPTWDDFEAADLGGGGATVYGKFLPRGIARGVNRGLLNV